MAACNCDVAHKSGYGCNSERPETEPRPVEGRRSSAMAFGYACAGSGEGAKRQPVEPSLQSAAVAVAVADVTLALPATTSTGRSFGARDGYVDARFNENKDRTLAVRRLSGRQPLAD